ncbi:MAG TPA: hypothetical protein PLW83_10100, partial [Deltaproteobacteria bacterium]|nr:hypothetical protein [Deltaproteobacteria bacterium]
GYLITGRRTGWSLVRGAYVFGAFMAPLTLTDWYFTGMYSYYWGFFAKKAVLYDVMSTVWLAGVVFAIRILFTAFRKVEERRKRTLKKVLIAFISLAALSLTNTPAIYGYEIYPLGTFVFLPLLYLTYSIFTYNLSMALQHLRRVLSWGGFSVLLVATACLPAAGFGWSRGAFITGIVLAGVLHMPIRGAWDAFLNLFIPLDTDILRERYRSFTSDLSHVHRLDELHRLCASWLFSALGTTRVTSLFPRTDESGFAGWTSFNGMPGAGLFEDRAVSGANETGVHADAADPLIRVCGKTRKVMAREEMSHVPGCGCVQGSASPAVEDAEMTVPVYSHDRLVAVILLGRKLDGSRYS